jgi:hypothetical protein
MSEAVLDFSLWSLRLMSEEEDFPYIISHFSFTHLKLHGYPHCSPSIPMTNENCQMIHGKSRLRSTIPGTARD